MKNHKLKSLLSLIITVSVMFSVLPATFAEEDDASPYDEYFDGEEYAYTLNGMTWNALMSDFMAAYKIKDWQLGFGYYNTVTGETHFYNGDTYFTAASIYKLPLCMYFTDKINNGELEADGLYRGFKVSELIKGAIEVSNNDYARVMLKDFTKDKTFTSEISKYLGVNLEKENSSSKYFQKGNFNFTPRQVIHCLNTIWSNPDEYQRIIDHMLRATPGNYFLFHEQAFTVAHKYGYLEDQGYLFVNDCGFCYTDDPICLIMFTKGVSFENRDVLADFCTLMCDYAQASREQRLEKEAEEEARLQAEEEARLAREVEEAQLEQEAKAHVLYEQQMEESAKPEETNLADNTIRLTVIWVLLAASGCCICTELIFSVSRKKK